MIRLKYISLPNSFFSILAALSFIMIMPVGMAQSPVKVAGQATITAQQSGNWTSTATWGGALPAENARVLIPDGITVTIDGIINTAFKSVRIATGGKLQYATDTNTELRTEFLVTEMGGAFEIGNSNNSIPANFTAKLVFAWRGGTTKSEDPGRYAPGAVFMGPVRMYGAEKTSWTTLAEKPIAGATQLNLNATPIGWQVGDVITVAGTDINDYKSDEQVTISSISGNMVTLSSALQKSHQPPEQLMNLVDVHVSNNTRNIVISSENTSVTALAGTNGYGKPRGHLMFMHNADVVLKYMETRGIGRTDKSIRLDDWSVPEDESVLFSTTIPYPAIPGGGKNPRGRYSIHFHRTLDTNTNKALVEGCVVNNDPGWGYTNHSSHVDFINNVSYDILGSAYCTEAGDELGSFRRNIAIRTYNPDEPINLGRPAGGRIGEQGGSTDGVVDSREGISDFAFQGDGFWLHSTGVTLEGNVVSGSSGHAYIYWTEGLWESLRGRPEMQNKIDLYVPPNEFPELNTELKTRVAQYPNWKFDVWYILPRPFKDNIGYASAQGFRGDYIMTEFHEDNDPESPLFNLMPPNYRNTMNLVIENTLLWSIRRTGMQFENCAQITLKNNRVYGYGTSPNLAPWRPVPNPYPGYLEDEPEVIGLDLDQYHNTRSWTLENNTLAGWQGEAQAITLPINAVTVVNGGTFDNSGTDLYIREVNWARDWTERIVSYEDNNLDPTPADKTTPWRTITIQGNIEFKNASKNIVMDPQFHLVNNAGDAWALFHPLGSGVKMPAYFLLPDQITLNFGPFNNSRLYFNQQRADFVPVPSADLLRPFTYPSEELFTEQITPNKYLGLTNQQLKAQFGSSFGGQILPENAVFHTMIVGGKATNVSNATNQLPVVNITAPANNSTFDSGQTVMIEASASDPDGTVRQVEFFVNDTSIGIDNHSPFSMAWTTRGSGNQTLKAVATDNAGATTTSAIVNIIINQTAQNQPPVVNIASPDNNSIMSKGEIINIEATATDADGSVSQVAFFVNDNPIGTDISAPYVSSWTANETGNYNIKAVATDNEGATTTSATVMISVNVVLSIDQEVLATKVYPNPVHGNLVTLSLSGLTGKMKVQFLDLSGKVLLTNEFMIQGETERVIDISQLQNGPHLIRLANKQRVKTLKLIKK